MRGSLLILSFLWLTACQTTQDKPTATPKKTTSSEAFINQIKANGDKMFCNQPGYLQCYRQTKSRCMKDLSAYKEICIQQTIKKDVTKVPVLGDIPGVGALFRSSSEANSKRELLIFVTPKIVVESI
mgnify:CR=1 FL=1